MSATADPAILHRVLELAHELGRSRRRNRLSIEYATPWGPATPGPYPWQQRFHDAGATALQRAIFAGNRCGKSRTGAAEAAIHATGLYPDWWRGKRFDTPTRGIVAAEKNEMMRDSIQPELVGELIEGSKEPSGEGWIPKDRIVDWSYQAANVRNVLDYVTVRHISGGLSRIRFKSYAQGRTSFEAVKLHWLWFDEEPPFDIYEEGLMRLVDENGIVFITRTPLYGYTKIVQKFLNNDPQTWFCTASWSDSPHMDRQRREQFMSTITDKHTLDTRMGGAPLKGSGGVYNVSEDLWVIDPIRLQPHWARINGMDFGIGHPFGAVFCAHDRDRDVFYIYDEYRVRDHTPQQHAAVLMARPGSRSPWAWPHDGLKRDYGSGEQLKAPYAAAGLPMLSMSARYDDSSGGPQSRERCTGNIIEGMSSGQVKVFSTCRQLLEEVRMLHRKDGVVNAECDDLESAMRYAYMMRRYGRAKDDDWRRRPAMVDQSHYDPHQRWRRSA